MFDGLPYLLLIVFIVVVACVSVYNTAKYAREHKEALEQKLLQYLSSDWRSADNVCMRILWDDEYVTRNALLDTLQRLIKEGKIECRVPENFSGRLGECRIAQSSA